VQVDYHIISSNDGGESQERARKASLSVVRKLARFGLFVLTTESVNSFESIATLREFPDHGMFCITGFTAVILELTARKKEREKKNKESHSCSTALHFMVLHTPGLPFLSL
jgi:hypothetical protein